MLCINAMQCSKNVSDSANDRSFEIPKTVSLNCLGLQGIVPVIIERHEQSDVSLETRKSQHFLTNSKRRYGCEENAENNGSSR